MGHLSTRQLALAYQCDELWYVASLDNWADDEHTEIMLRTPVMNYRGHPDLRFSEVRIRRISGEFPKCSKPIHMPPFQWEIGMKVSRLLCVSSLSGHARLSTLAEEAPGISVPSTSGAFFRIARIDFANGVDTFLHGRARRSPEQH